MKQRKSAGKAVISRRVFGAAALGAASGSALLARQSEKEITAASVPGDPQLLRHKQEQ